MSESKFNCYQSKNAVETPLLAPTPCCGITAPPAGFLCDLTLVGDPGCPDIALQPGTYTDLVFTPLSTCSTTYAHSQSPIAIIFEPTFCIRKDGYKSPPVGFDYSGQPLSGPTGSCYILNGNTVINVSITVDANPPPNGNGCIATLVVKGVVK